MIKVRLIATRVSEFDAPCKTVFVPLGLDDPQLHALRVDIRQLEVRRFAQPQTGCARRIQSALGLLQTQRHCER